MTPRYAHLIALATCFAGCLSPSDVPSEDAPAASAQAPDEPRGHEVRPGVPLDRILSADSAAIQRLDAPRARQASPVANAATPGPVDSLVTLQYDGLVIETLVLATGRTLVRRVIATEGTYGSRDGVSVGEARATLEEILGAPVRQAGDTATYAIDGPMPTRVEVRYDRDDDGTPRATQIAWTLPVD